MEIISYVGANSRNQDGFSNLKIRPLLKRLQSIELPLKSRRNARFSLAPQACVVRHPFSLRDFLISAGNAVDFFVKNSWVFALCIATAATPFLVSAFVAWHSSFATGVSLEEISAVEIEILDKAMNDFALESGREIDENGNVLNADGSSAIVPVADFRQKVTFSEYKVRSGDTISGISRKFGLSNISTLIAVNGISNVRQLKSGQNLKIPSADGLVHSVKSGDSLSSLSVKYGVTVEDLLDVNDLESQVLTAGQILFIPGARLSSETLRMAMGELFTWPLKGSWRLTSNYGRRADPFTGVTSFHTGIDMAMPSGTPVYSSMSGKIESVGYTNIFGNYVIIKHVNGYQTLYAHLTKSLVKSGQNVAQGAKIGLVGSTGYSTGPHLHFTVFKNGKLVDPMTVLKR
ncbi:MAG: M23 family metallopeptidase [Treponema sp.]|nr:M23 family metallopeptidase [Treponema sp.]MDY2924747.1 M23 family metallopeptidase [Treponema sp.]